MRNARRITLLGILLLCTGFFLPQVRGCKEDVVPVMWTVDSSGCFLVQWGLPFVFAFAAVIFLGLRRLARSEKAAKWIRRAACVFCVLILAYAGALEALLSVDLAPLVVDDVCA